MAVDWTGADFLVVWIGMFGVAAGWHFAVLIAFWPMQAIAELFRLFSRTPNLGRGDML